MLGQASLTVGDGVLTGAIVPFSYSAGTTESFTETLGAMGKMVHFLNQDDLGYYDSDCDIGRVFNNFLRFFNRLIPKKRTTIKLY